MSFKWSRDAYVMHFGFCPILISIATIFFTLDEGWFLDLICLLVFLGGCILFLGIFQLEKIIIREDEVLIIPAFGKVSSISFKDIEHAIVTQDERRSKSVVQVTFELKLITADKEHVISENTENITELISHIEKRIGVDKFEVIDKTKE